MPLPLVWHFGNHSPVNGAPVLMAFKCPTPVLSPSTTPSDLSCFCSCSATHSSLAISIHGHRFAFLSFPFHSIPYHAIPIQSGWLLLGWQLSHCGHCHSQAKSHSCGQSQPASQPEVQLKSWPTSTPSNIVPPPKTHSHCHSAVFVYGLRSGSSVWVLCLRFV